MNRGIVRALGYIILVKASWFNFTSAQILLEDIV